MMILKLVAKKILKPKRIGVYRQINCCGLKFKFFSKKFTICTVEERNNEILIKNETIQKLNNKILMKNEIMQELENKCSMKQNNIIEREKQKNQLIEEIEKQKSEIERYKFQLNEQLENERLIAKNRLNELDEYCKRLEEDVNKKSRFKRDAWCTGWIDFWREYYNQHYNDITDKINKLKENLDEESKGIIDLMIERNFKILPNQEYTDTFLYNHDKLYTDFEKNGLKNPFNLQEARKQFVIPEEYYLETSVFEFHNGLKLLDEDILKSIEGKDIIDGGALWGDSALVFNSYNPKSIHSFEPMAKNFKQLLETIENNNMNNIVPVFMGLGERKEGKTIYTHGMLSGSNLFNCKPVFDETDTSTESSISIISIDEYVKEKNLNVGLIKLDVEGYELETIKGAIETIKTQTPVLSISIYHLPKDFFEIKPMLEAMNLGYKFFIRKLVYHDLTTEVTLMGYVENSK